MNILLLFSIYRIITTGFAACLNFLHLITAFVLLHHIEYILAAAACIPLTVQFFYTTPRQETYGAYKNGRVLCSLAVFSANSMATLMEPCLSHLVCVTTGIFAIIMVIRYHIMDLPTHITLEWDENAESAGPDDQRDAMYKIGSHNPVTETAYLRVSFDDGNINIDEYIKVDRSFVEYQLARNVADVNYSAARMLYGLDRYSNLSNRERVSIVDATCRALVYFQLQRKIDIAVAKRRLDLITESNEATCKNEYRRLYKSLRVVSKHRFLQWITYLLQMTMLVAIIYITASSVAEYVKTPSYLTAHHSPFTGVGLPPKPAVRAGFRAKLGIRKNPSVTVSESLLTSNLMPCMRNLQFDRNDPTVAMGAAEYRLATSNGMATYTEDQVKFIDRLIDSLALDFSKYLDGKDLFDIMSPDSVHEWIDSRPYTQVRKAQLHLQVRELEVNFDMTVEPHIKNESYAKTNKPRFICARRDSGKVLFGPIFDAMNDWFFHLAFTTKHIPAKQRPAYIENYLSHVNASYMVTDHSSFEAAATYEVQQMIEMKLYRKCTPVYVHPILDELLKEQNMIHMQTGTRMKIPTMRFSGEMNTSLGNSLLNYVSIMTAAHTMGKDVKCVIEGDDSLIMGPSDMDPRIYKEIMSKMGFNIKIETPKSLGSAGYCSSRWTSDLQPMPDARKFLPDLFWTDPSSLKHMQRQDLLTAKAMSYAVECPYMPVMYKVYQQYLKSVGMCKLNQYELECMSRDFQVEATKHGYTIKGDFDVREPTMEERARYDELYGLDITTQLALESYYDHSPADALESYFAAIGGDLKFVTEQYASQVHN